jgi:hypothetical protein
MCSADTEAVTARSANKESIAYENQLKAYGILIIKLHPRGLLLKLVQHVVT